MAAMFKVSKGAPQVILDLVDADGRGVKAAATKAVDDVRQPRLSRAGRGPAGWLG